MLYHHAKNSIKLKLILLGWAILICNGTMAQTPVAYFGVSASTGCAPLNVVFTDSSQNATNYFWSFGNGNTAVLKNPSNVFLTSGTYTVTLTASDSITGQSSTFSKTIIVLQSPVANFTISNTSGCQSSQVFNFQNNSLNYDSCLWDFGDGTTSSVTSPQHIYNIPGVFNVTLIAFNKAYGCSDTKTQVAIITVHPKPNLTFVVNDSITCDSAKVFQFTASANNVLSWSWDFGDGQTSSIQNPFHVYNDTGYFSITVTAVSANGCPATLTKQNYIHIKYNPNPNSIVNISTTSGCQPLYVSMIPMYSSFSYQWNLGDSSGVFNSFAVYHNYASAGQFSPNVTVDYNNGCITTAPLGLISVFPKPQTNYSVNNFIGCAPLNVSFINNTPGTTNTYLWDFGNGITSTQSNPVYTYNNAGLYQVSLTVTSVNGCSYGYPLSGRVTVYAPEAVLIQILLLVALHLQ